MNKYIGLLLFPSVLLLHSVVARAADVKPSLQIPDSAHVQILTFSDGTTSMGRITSVDSATIGFRTSFGEMTVAIGKIEEIRTVAVTGIKEGKYWFPNPNATRLFFAPTAHMLKQGKGYLSDIYVFFPSVTFGITDQITMGGGMSLFPGAGMDKQLFFFTPKAGFSPSPDLHLAAGALIISVPTFDDDGSGAVSAGIVYGVGTYGTVDNSFTAGLGYGYADKEMADKPMVMLGGEYRLSRRVAFVSENWIFPGLDQPVVSAGLRFFGEGMCFDLAMVTVIGGEMDSFVIPYADFVINF
jgi:hypothetical protein